MDIAVNGISINKLAWSSTTQAYSKQYYLVSISHCVCMIYIILLETRGVREHHAQPYSAEYPRSRIRRESADGTANGTRPGIDSSSFFPMAGL